MKKAFAILTLAILGLQGWSGCRDGHFAVSSGGSDWCCVSTSSTASSCTDGRGCWICVGTCTGPDSGNSCYGGGGGLYAL